MWLHPSQFGMAFGVLSTSSRVGDVASKVLLGRFAARGCSWRTLFFLASALQLLVAAVNLVLLPRPVPRSPMGDAASGGASKAGEGDKEAALAAEGGERDKKLYPLEKVNLSQALWQTVLTERFACIALGVASLHVVMEFDKYLPLYLHKSLKISPGLAAQAAALYPLSQLLSLAIAGYHYDRLTSLWVPSSLCPHRSAL